MKYVSTRGSCDPQSFEEVLLTGLAPDGGLYVPQSLPSVSIEQMERWKDLSYSHLAFEIITPFIDGAIPEQELKDIIDASYQEFDHPDVAPISQLGENEYVLELFHGPTLAFKDFALQVLGRMLDCVLKKNQQKATQIQQLMLNYRSLLSRVLTLWVV